MFIRLLFIGTDGGTRTHMVSRWILNPVRLPIPPHRHKMFRNRFKNLLRNLLIVIILAYFFRKV